MPAFTYLMTGYGFFYFYINFISSKRWQAETKQKIKRNKRKKIMLTGLCIFFQTFVSLVFAISLAEECKDMRNNTNPDRIWGKLDGNVNFYMYFFTTLLMLFAWMHTYFKLAKKFSMKKGNPLWYVWITSLTYFWSFGFREIYNITKGFSNEDIYKM